MSENKENPPQSQIPNNTENRKNYKQKITGLKDSIDKRRYQVYQMDLQGFSNTEIAEKLGTSLSTIEKDLHHMRYFCIKWTKEVLQDRRTKSFLDSCSQIDLAQGELWRMYRKETDVNAKKRILDSIVANSIKKEKGCQDKIPIYEKEEKQLEELIGKPD